MTGSRCFKCNGRGYVLTGRGLAALDFYRELLSKPVGTLQPGTLVKDRDGKRCTLVAVRPSEQLYGDGSGGWAVRPGTVDYTLEYRNTTCGYCGVQADELLRVRSWTPAQAQHMLAGAVQYQATLTTSGKPRVRRAAKVAA
jgi:hypothetical protein